MTDLPVLATVTNSAGGAASASATATVSGPTGAAVVHGMVPADGYISGSAALASQAGWRFVQPNVTPGQRLSGSVTIGRIEIFTNSSPPGPPLPPATLNAIPMRLLVDGVEQPSWTLDTTQWPEGTHVLGVQVINPIDKIENGSRIVVFNQGTAPVQAKTGQAIVGHFFHSAHFNSLAWARVDVRDPLPYPMGHPAATHPQPTDADAERLATGNVWWLEGLQHQGTGLYTQYPMLVKNAQGDYFTTQWNPQFGTSSLGALAVVQAAPAFDGPRGIGILSPYATPVAGTRVLASGHRGWLAVDIAGRLVDVDIIGEVTTIFGPRSVAGMVQTDPELTTRTLAQRVVAGEKEYVGTGERLVMPQDLWPLSDDMTLIADTGVGKVSRVSRSLGSIVSSVSAPTVTSVWYGFGSEWWVTKNTLWRDGAPVATITDAFFVRGDGARGSVYVLTDMMKLYEVDPATNAATLRKAGETAHIPFVFMDVDIWGHAGPKGRIYFSMSNGYESNTGIHYCDPGIWAEFKWQPKIFNAGNVFTSEQARSDTFGHYLWGLSIHPDEAMWISGGISNTSWKVATAHLGPQPPLDPPIAQAVYQLGRDLVRVGRRDRNLGLGHVFGGWGHGGLGCSVDELRRGTIADFRAMVDPLLPAGYTEAERNGVATYLWAQRTRPHFQAVP